MNIEKLEFIQQRIVQLRQFLLSNNSVTSISQDGMSITFDRGGAVQELKDLEKQERDLLNPGRHRKHIDLGGAF